MSDDGPVAPIATVPPGDAITGLQPYEPKSLALTYETERFGKTIELPMAAYCPHCSKPNDHHYDLMIVDDADGDPYAKCTRCGGTTKQQVMTDEDRLYEMTRKVEQVNRNPTIEGALESFGSVIMPMDEFKRVGKILAKDPSLHAVAHVGDRILKIDWQTLRSQVKGFRRGTEEWPGVNVRFWVPA